MSATAAPAKPSRCPGWQSLLDDYVQTHAQVPFDWHLHNCATFATRWVELATGVQLQVPDTPTVRHALRSVVQIGGLHADACKQLGEPVPGAFARVGDFVLLKLPRSRGRVAKVFGVCLGGVVAGQGARGLVMVPITQAEAAWRV